MNDFIIVSDISQASLPQCSLLLGTNHSPVRLENPREVFIDQVLNCRSNRLGAIKN